MKSKLFCNLPPEPWLSKLPHLRFCGFVLAAMTLAAPNAHAGDAPPWMRALTSVALPAHDDKDSVVQLYSEEILNVSSNGKLKSVRRVAYKILRPDGKDFGVARGYIDSETKITGMRGWCIPAQGKDYEVKEKESVESALPGVTIGQQVELIPEADPNKVYVGQVMRRSGVFGARKLQSDDPSEATDERVVEVVVSADSAPFLVGQRVLVKFVKPGHVAGRPGRG